jgi:hypothetical protein
MTIATSADGTSIAFSSRGDGRTVVIVNGALSTAAEAVGLPREMVDAGRTSGMLDALAPLGQSTVYDVRLTSRLRRPGRELLDVAPAVTVLRGAQTFPFLMASSDRLAAESPDAELVIVPESVMHRPDPVATARVVAERM